LPLNRGSAVEFPSMVRKLIGEGSRLVFVRNNEM